MPTIQQWLSAYGESHKNEANKTIHWICIPVIFFSIVGLFYTIKLPVSLSGIQLNIAMIVMGFVVLYYFYLSRTLWVGMLIFGFACLVLCHLIEKSGIMPLWLFCVILFVSA